MTRSQIRTQVRSQLGDTASLKFTDAEINTWIDLATDQIITLLDFDTAMATISTVLGEPNYQLPSNANSIREVFVTADDGKEYRLEITDQGDLASLYGLGWRSDSNSRPSVCYRADYNVLGLYPPPNAANASRTIRFFYKRRSSDASGDTDSPIYLPMLHMANVHWSTAQGMMRIKDLTSASFHLNQFKQYFAQAWHRAQTFAEEQWAWRFI